MTAEHRNPDPRGLLDENDDWDGDGNELVDLLPGWEPWAEYDETGHYVPDHDAGCSYCASDDRSMLDPFGARPCCRRCFDLLIDGDETLSPIYEEALR